MKKLLLIGIGVLLIAGCGDRRTLRTIQPDRAIQGLPTQQVILVVPKEFDQAVREGQTIVKMPDGVYRAVAEDDSGIFFKSPERITRLPTTNKTYGISIEVMDGGILLTHNNVGYIWYTFSITKPVVYQEPIQQGRFRVEPKP